MTLERDIENSTKRRHPHRHPVPTRAERGSFKKALVDFDVPREALETLDRFQIEVLAKLKTVVGRVESLFAMQESSDDKGKFYPEDASKAELNREAEINPAIDSPYPVVVRAEDGSLRTIPAHIYYGAAIKNKGIVKRLKEAAREAGKGKKRDSQFQTYLNKKADALENGDYKAAERAWLSMDHEPVVDLMFGLYDTYIDRFRHKKYAWSASVGVLNPELTAHSQWFTDKFLSWWEKDNGKEAPRVRVRIDHTRLYAGVPARMEFAAESYPCQPEWRKELGSKFIIFEPAFKDQLDHRWLHAFRDFIDPSKMQGITDAFVSTSALRLYTAHELGHSLETEEDFERFQNEKDWLKELDCELEAIVGYREIEGVSKKESEIAFALSLASGYMEFARRPRRKDYYKAFTQIPGYLIQEGILRIENGKFTWQNTEETFDALRKMRHQVKSLITNGRLRDVQVFDRNYFNQEIYNFLLTGSTYPSDLQFEAGSPIQN